MSTKDLPFPCDSCHTTFGAAFNGHLICLQRAYQQRSQWDFDTIYWAAACNNVACLKYAYEHDCPWHQWTTHIAAYNNSLECLKYIYENCGDVATWELSGLHFFEQDSGYSERIKAYLRTVVGDWKQGLNISSTPKPARR